MNPQAPGTIVEAPPANPRPPGTIITFYSYKGGTGRSMALANVAWILATNGKRVLAVDWDLEAPGLHRYFSPFLHDPDLLASEGLIDFVTDFAVEAMTPPAGGTEQDPRWFEPLADLLRYALPLDYKFPNGGSLDFVPAGKQGPSYASRVNTFNWQTFYDRLGGGVFLEAARTKMRQEYEFVLIDSRTGVSDTSGVCTVQMPDAVVICFTANNQSIEGAAGVAASVREQWAQDKRRANVPARIFPLLTRVEPAEKEKLEMRRELTRAEFKSFLEPLSAKGRDEYWGNAETPYVPFYAYEEVLATFGDKPGHRSSLLTAMEQLTTFLTDGKVSALVPPAEEERREVLAKYSRRRNLTNPSAAAEEVPDVYLSYSTANAAAVEKVAARLRQGGVKVWLDKWNIAPGTDWQVAVGDAVKRAPACAVFVGAEGLGQRQESEVLGVIAEQAKERGTAFRLIPVLLPGARTELLPDLLQRYQWVDLRRSLEDENALRQLVTALRGAAPDPVMQEAQSPYRGLQSFNVEHAAFFHGREALIATLVEKVRSLDSSAANRLLAIVGPAGSGKSSLARAGLIAALQRGALPGSARWPVVTLRPGSNPLECLAAALVAVSATATTQSRRPSDVQDLIASVAKNENTLHLTACLALPPQLTDGRVVVLVDHLDELFTLCNNEAWRRAFIDNLLYAARVSGGSTVIVATLRDDARADCAAYPALAEALAQHQVSVEPMTAVEMRFAIEEPARSTGLEFEPGLVDRLLHEAGDQAYGLALLQYVLADLWERREGQRLTAKAYEASGGIQGARLRQAEALYATLTPRDQPVCRCLCLRLVLVLNETEDRRQRLRVQDLRPAELPAADFDGVLRALVDGRLLLVTGDLAESAAEVELAHDTLLTSWPRLRAWLKEERPGIYVRQRLTVRARDWDRSGRPDDVLLDAARLPEVQTWVEKHPAVLTALEAAFLKASKDKGEREQAQRRKKMTSLVSGLSGATMLALVAGILVLFDRGEQATAFGYTGFIHGADEKIADAKKIAKEAVDKANVESQDAAAVKAKAAEDVKAAQDEARSLRLAVQVEQMRGSTGPGNWLRLLLAAEAVKSAVDAGKEPNPFAEQALRDVLGKLAAKTVEAQKANWVRVRVSPDGKWLAAGSSETVLHLWNLTDGLTPVSSLPNVNGEVFEFSADSKWLATAGSLEDNNSCGAEDLPDKPRVPGPPRLWNLQDKEPAERPRELSELRGRTFTQIGVCNEGRRLFTVSAETGFELWAVGERGLNKVLHLPTNQVGRFDLSADGLWLATTIGGDPVTLRDLRGIGDDKPHKSLGLGQKVESVTSLAFNPDGELLATGTRENIVRLWNVKEGTQIAELSGHKGIISFLTFSADKLWLVTTSLDGTSRLWDLQRIKGDQSVVLGDYGLPGTGASQVVFSPDCSRLVTKVDGVTAWVWNVRSKDPTSGPQAVRLEKPAKFVANRTPAFSINNRWLITGDEPINLWPLRANELFQTAENAAQRKKLAVEEWQRYLPELPYRSTFKGPPVKTN